MSDKELLERAAKAAEMGGGWEEAWQEYVCPTRKSSEAQFWRPLTDDGDAFRLAVKLGLYVRYHKPLGQGLVTTVGGDEFQVNVEDCKHSPEAATRRAIVRAAAAIGSTP